MKIKDYVNYSHNAILSGEFPLVKGTKVFIRKGTKVFEGVILSKKSDTSYEVCVDGETKSIDVNIKDIVCSARCAEKEGVFKITDSVVSYDTLIKGNDNDIINGIIKLVPTISDDQISDLMDKIESSPFDNGTIFWIVLSTKELDSLTKLTILTSLNLDGSWVYILYSDTDLDS